MNRFSIARHGRELTFKELFGTASLSKFSNVPAVTQAASAGYGDPLERDPGLVAQDVKNEYMSPARARADYGVVLDLATGEVDLHATRALRAELRERPRART